MTRDTSVPRVASSIDDLRVGQVVALREFREFGDERWTIQHVTKPELWQVNLDDGDFIIILSDPPEPVSVSREAFDRLVKAIENHSSEPCPIEVAARALVDEVQGQA